jgi:hypothetical protein
VQDDTDGADFSLTGVTMFEAVTRLRERGLYIQFEREQLDEQNVDRGRPVVDSRRRFNAESSPANQLLDALCQADGGYDWVELTQTPASYFVFPRSDSEDRFAASAMAWQVGPVETAGHPLSELVNESLGLQEHQITVFDRAEFLKQVMHAPEVQTAGRPLFKALGELFALSGKKLTWTLGGVGGGRVLSVGMLPDGPNSAAGPE